MGEVNVAWQVLEMLEFLDWLSAARFVILCWIFINDQRTKFIFYVQLCCIRIENAFI